MSSVSRFFRSPMCWLGKTSLSLDRQKLAFCSAPQARIGGRVLLSFTGKGTSPRDLLAKYSLPSSTQQSESSQRVWMSRLWSRKPSAMPVSSLTASAFSISIGVSERLALVITSRSISSPNSSTCSGV